MNKAKMNKKNSNKGFVLVFTLIIMSIILVAALGIAGTTIIERKNAGVTSRSAQSFQLADSGAEDAAKTLQLNPAYALGTGGIYGAACSGSPATVKNRSLALALGSGNAYDISFYKKDATGAIVPATCSDYAYQITNMHIAGSHNKTIRAVDVPICISPIISDGKTVTAGLWHFEDMVRSGGIIKDSSDSTGMTTPNNGTATGTQGAEAVCKSRYFNGTSDYISVPASSGSLDIDSYPVTMEALISPNDINDVQMIVSRGVQGVNGYGMQLNGPNATKGVINCGWHASGNFDSVYTDLLATGNWYYVVCVMNGASSKVYINGADRTPASIVTANMVASGDNLIIGAYYNGSSYSNYFNGIIDEVKISNTAKDSSYVQSNYNNIKLAHPELNLP